MALNPVIAKLGRRIRLGIVGGGEGALIAGAHRTAIQFDGTYDIVAAVLSRDPGKSRDQARGLGIERSYADVAEMLSLEKSHPQSIDAIAIMTPNDTHVEMAGKALDAGIHVICDKPIANTLAEAWSLKKKIDASGLELCVTHNYSGYPMIRQARELVAGGALGRVHLVEVRYAQGNLGTLVEMQPDSMVKQLVWRLDPKQGGENHLLLDVGTHAHQLVSYILSRKFKKVSARLSAIHPHRSFADTAMVSAELADDVHASMFITKAATGAPHIFTIAVYGDKGGLSWEQAQPQLLQVFRQSKPTETLHRGADTLSPLARRSIRVPEPHPEGFREAFANIYSDFAERVASRIAGVKPDPLAMTMPTIEDGIDSLAFVEACAESHRKQTSVRLDHN